MNDCPKCNKPVPEDRAGPVIVCVLWLLAVCWVGTLAVAVASWR